MKILFLHLLLVGPVLVCATGAPIRPSSRQVADLKTFFHGEQPPLAKAPPPKVLATVAYASGVAADLQVEGFMKAFAAALMARDGEPLLPRLSDQYAIADLPEGHKASDLFLQAIGRLPGPQEILIQSIETTGDVRTARMEFRYANSTVKSRTLKFDAAGRLLSSDLFALKFEQHGL